MKTLFALLIALALAGCGVVAQKKSDELLARSTRADWGELPSTHQIAEKATITKTLIDPESARFRFAPPRRGTANLKNGPVLAWFSDVWVNAKNRLGGYTGEQAYGFAYQCIPNSSCKLVGYATPDKDNPQRQDWEALE